MTVTSLLSSHPVSLTLVDPATVGDDDTWIESCVQCGTLENCGDLFCTECDELAA